MVVSVDMGVVIQLLLLTFMLLFLAVLVTLALFLLVHAWYMHRYITPFVPIKKEQIDTMFKHLGNVEGKTLLDMGSGTGDVLLAGSEKGAYVIGVEINPLLNVVAYARLGVRGMLGQSKGIYWADFLKCKLPKADVMMLYLMPEVNQALRDRLEKEVAEGTIIVTNRFPIEGWEPDILDGWIRIYRVPCAS